MSALIAKWGAAIATSGLVLNIVVRILNKIDFSKWYDFVRESCKGISKAGNAKFTRPIYEPFETFFQGLLSGTVKAANEGLDFDDSAEAKPDDKKK